MPRLTNKGFGRGDAQRRFETISAHELGRPKARLGNPNTGIPEVIVQPEYDIYAVAPGSAMGLLTLFSVVQNQTYNFNGVTAFSKSPGHVTLVQPGMLESSYTYIVRALAITVTALQGQATPILSPIDATNFLHSFMQFRINRKSYFDGIGAWLPCAGGVYMSAAATPLPSTAIAVGTTFYGVNNGLPHAGNMYVIPGGQYINPQEQFDFIINPTLNAGGTPTATAATLPATAANANAPGAGLMAWVRLDGTLIRVAQ